MAIKMNVSDLGVAGGAKIFEQIKSVSNLVKPDVEKFLGYSRLFHHAGVVTGHGQVEQLMERRLAQFHDVQHCVSFCGGFWGLVMAMKCLALPGRTEVVMPSLTYRRLADIVAWAGLTPHFCEVDPDLLCITAETARPCINENTALILGVHPIINCCDIDGLEALSEQTGIPLLIDAVESVYESYKGRKIGSCARAECFSMQSSKLFNAFEGGYVTTNDGELAARLRIMRDAGINIKGLRAESVGMGVVQNEMHAAMALACLDDVDAQMEANRGRYRTYQRCLENIPGISLRRFDEQERCGYKNILVELHNDWPFTREATIALLNAENMLCRPYYSPALHMKKTGYPMLWGELRQTEELAKRFLLLPCGYFVSEGDIENIAEFLAFIQKNADAIKEKGLV